MRDPRDGRCSLTSCSPKSSKAITVAQVIAHSSRFTDLTAPDQSFEPGGNVSAVAEDIVDSRSRPLQLVRFSTEAGPHPCGNFELLVNRIGQNSAGSRFGADPHPVLRQSKNGLRRAPFACRKLDDMEQAKGDSDRDQDTESQKSIGLTGRLGHERLALATRGSPRLRSFRRVHQTTQGIPAAR
jgi:hypothetical protein